MKRKLKYIKLYEAFDSELMSKTLGFIKPEYRNVFIVEIKRICDIIEYPYSELSDDLFEYLPFNLALKKNIEQAPPEKIKCEQESPWIPGEFCQEGKIKRTWGDHTRMVECPNCKGKGFTLSKVKYNVKLIKFWFSKEGKYIKNTATDGKESEADLNVESLDGYNIVSQLTSASEINSLPDESLLWVKLRDHSGFTIAKVLQEQGRSYLFQNYHEGDSPRTLSIRERGREFGRYSWVVTNNNDFREAYSIEPGTGDDKGDKLYDYYRLNKKYDIRYNEIIVGSSVSRIDLKEASFAIILDFSKLKSKDFTKRSDIRLTRSEMRKGSLSLKKHEEIRKENLERYLNKLVSTYSKDRGFSNVNRIISVGLSSMPLSFIAYRINFSYIESAITNIYFSIKNDDFSILSSYLKRVYNEKNERLENFKRNIDAGKKSFEKSNSEEDKERLKLWEKWEFLNKKLFEKIQSYNCETIEEIEILWGKILTIRLIFDNGERYPNIHRFNSVIRYISTSYSLYSELSENFTSTRIKEAMEELEILEKIIDSL
jgi:hypothetical protein